MGVDTELLHGCPERRETPTDRPVGRSLLGLLAATVPVAGIRALWRSHPLSSWLLDPGDTFCDHRCYCCCCCYLALLALSARGAIGGRAEGAGGLDVVDKIYPDFCALLDDYTEIQLRDTTRQTGRGQGNDGIRSVSQLHSNTHTSFLFLPLSGDLLSPPRTLASSSRSADRLIHTFPPPSLRHGGADE